MCTFYPHDVHLFRNFCGSVRILNYQENCGQVGHVFRLSANVPNLVGCGRPVVVEIVSKNTKFTKVNDPEDCR